MSRSRLLAFILVILAAALPALAQIPDAPSSTPRPAQGQANTRSPEPHRFWDKTNVLLFAGVAGARALDGASTMYMRNRGVDEWLLTNEVVDNHVAFGFIEAAGVAASVGLSYLFHRTGHHKIERVVSIIHIGVGTGGAIRNFTLP